MLEAILKANGYTWSLMLGQGNANAMPSLLKRATCVAQMREAGHPDSSWQKYARLFRVSTNATVLTQFKQDLAFFLLARGPYAWLGWGV